jgi:hypothetical protein
LYLHPTICIEHNNTEKEFNDILKKLNHQRPLGCVPRGALDAPVAAHETPIWRSPHEPQPLTYDTISGEEEEKNEVRGRQRLPVSNPEKYYI